MSEEIHQEPIEGEGDIKSSTGMNGHHHDAAAKSIDNNHEQQQDPFALLGPGPPPAPVIDEESTNDDDPFGMFASVDAPAPELPATESLQANPTEQPAPSGDAAMGDDFRAFSSSPPAGETKGDDFGLFNGGGETTEIPAVNGEGPSDFGSFSAASKKENGGGGMSEDRKFGLLGEPVEKVVEFPDAATNGFGDHGEQPASDGGGADQSTSPHTPPEKNSGDDFGELDLAEQQEAVATNTEDLGGLIDATETKTETIVGDNFDAFGAAAAKGVSAVDGDPPPGGVEEEKKELSEMDEAHEALSPEAPDGFGAVGDGQQETPVDNNFAGFSDPKAAGRTSAPANTGNGDFGDFGEAEEVSAPAPVSADDLGDFGQAQAAPAAQAAEVDFGDFGEAQEASSSTSANGKGDFGDFGEAGETPAVAATGNNDDDFGDFGEAQEASAQASMADVDEFGDFGEAEKAPVPAAADTDDDFGEFGEAQEAQAPTADDDDDDFGDFGEAEAAVAATDDDDDFGDFGEAEAAPAAAAIDDDFGDFGDAQEGPTASLPPPTGNPLVDKSRKVFAAAFGDHPLPPSEANDSSVDGDSTVTVADFLSTLLDSNDSRASHEAESRWSATTVSAMLDAIERTKPVAPTVVIYQDDTEPYGQYHYPVGGVRREDVAGKLRLLKRLESSRRSSFDESKTDTAGDLPPATFAPVDISSPSEVSASVPDVSPQATGGPANVKLDFTDFKAPEEREIGGGGKVGATSAAQPEGNGKSVSELAKQFLKQIPDISFMLKSELSLPSTSSKS